jgi:hypothetical protein
MKPPPDNEQVKLIPLTACDLTAKMGAEPADEASMKEKANTPRVRRQKRSTMPLKKISKQPVLNAVKSTLLFMRLPVPGTPALQMELRNMKNLPDYKHAGRESSRLHVGRR